MGTQKNAPKVNIFALPNQTTVIFCLIAVVFGAVVDGSIGPAPIPVWIFAVALPFLSIRAFLGRPERDFSRYKLSPASDEFADLQGQINDFALKIKLPEIPRLAITANDCLLKKDDIYTFGTFRHWYIAVNKEKADYLQNQLKNPETAPAIQAVLIHDLYHFKMADYWQLGYARELLRSSSLFMVWALMFFLGMGILLLLAKPDFINFDPAAQDQLPPMIKELFVKIFSSELMEEVRQRAAEINLVLVINFVVSKCYISVFSSEPVALVNLLAKTLVNALKKK